MIKSAHNVCFCSPELFGSGIVTRPHLGVAYLQSYLSDQGFDSYYFRHRELYSIRAYIDKLLSFSPQVVGFSVTDDTLDLFIALSNALQKRNPNIFIIVGGAIAKAESAEFMLANHYCHAVVIGEGEEPTASLLKTIGRSGKPSLCSFGSIPGVASRNKTDGQLIYTPNTKRVDINSYPSPILSGIVPEEDLPEIGVFSSRGCFFRCTYCSFSSNSEWQVRYYDQEIFLREVFLIAETIKKKKSSSKLAIWDDIFTLIPRRTKSLLTKIIEMNLGVEFWCQTRVDKITEEIVVLMKKAGVSHVGLGLESASPKVLKTVQKVRLKDFEKDGNDLEEKHLEKFLRFKSWARKTGLSYSINVIFGLPGETFDDAIQTLIFLRNLKPKYYFHNILRLYTGVPLSRAYTKLPHKVRSRNTGFRKEECAVGASIEQFPYPVEKIPPLPNRFRQPEIAVITGLAAEDERTNYPTIVFDCFPDPQLVKNIESNHHRILYLFDTWKNSSGGSKTHLSQLRFSACRTIPEADRPALSFRTFEFEHFTNKIDKAAAHYTSKTYDRYSDEADIYAVISSDKPSSFEHLIHFANIFIKGGSFRLPSHFLAIQFRGYFLKDACRWSSTCPALNGQRAFVKKDGTLTPCWTSKKGKEDFLKETLKARKRRGCDRCVVEAECSKCSCLPLKFENRYCDIQKSKFGPSNAVALLDFLCSQFLDPLNLNMTPLSVNEIVSPPGGLGKVLLIRFGFESFFLCKLHKSYRIFRLPEQLKLYDMIKRRWSETSPDRAVSNEASHDPKWEKLLQTLETMRVQTCG